MWGKSFNNLKQIGPDNILRLFGILLTDDDVKDFVSNLTGDTLSGKRPNIDANKGRIIVSYQMLLGKFIDWEVTIVLPSKWTGGAEEILSVCEHCSG